MRRIKPTGWFFICWFSICSLTGIWKYFNLPPVGIHQGAQADRATIAWNFYDQSMNFFKPRVMETRMNEGIVGMEFPVINYSVAVLYKIFGPKEIIYRMLVFLFVTMGAFGAWLISGFFIQKVLHRIILVFSWFLSPIFLYYAISFLPDPVAMSFGMLALYYFLRYYFGIQTKNSIGWYLLFITLAALIKVTFLIVHISVVIVLYFDKIYPGYLGATAAFFRNRLLVALCPLAPVIGWYTWSRWLTNHTGNTHFLQQINPAKNFNEFTKFISYTINTWNESIYFKNFIYIFIALFLFAFVKRRKEAPLISLLAVLLLLGAISAYLLFQFQFLYHDYYMFIFYPAFFFMMLFLQQVYIEGKRFFIGMVPILVTIGFYCLPLVNFSHTSKMISERFTPGSYYYQQAFPEQKYYHHLRSTIDSLVPKNEKLLSVFDPTPNTTLYFMRRQGIRIATDFSVPVASEIIEKHALQYMVLNDSLRWEKEFQPAIPMNKKLLYRYGVVSIWKIEKKIKAADSSAKN